MIWLVKHTTGMLRRCRFSEWKPEGTWWQGHIPYTCTCTRHTCSLWASVLLFSSPSSESVRTWRRFRNGKRSLVFSHFFMAGFTRERILCTCSSLKSLSSSAMKRCHSWKQKWLLVISTTYLVTCSIEWSRLDSRNPGLSSLTIN